LSAEPVSEAKTAFGSELVQQDRDHHLADRADLEQRPGRDRRSCIGIGEAEVEHASLAVGRH
jgi:hypothetical protein